jgi:hypothetical protein
MHWTRLREEEMVERLYAAADAVEDEDVRDEPLQGHLGRTRGLGAGDPEARAGRQARARLARTTAGPARGHR